MSWWCWTWVLYSENTVATSLEQSISVKLPQGYACGIRLFGRRRLRQLRPSRLAGLAAKWNLMQAGYWPRIGSTRNVSLAQGDAWGSRLKRPPGWPRNKKHHL